MTTLSIVPGGYNFWINFFPYGFSIDLLNIELLLNLAFCFLILLPSFSFSLQKSLLCSTYGFKNGSCLNSNILLIFLVVTLNLNKLVSSDKGFCEISYNCLDNR